MSDRQRPRSAASLRVDPNITGITGALPPEVTTEHLQASRQRINAALTDLGKATWEHNQVLAVASPAEDIARSASNRREAESNLDVLIRYDVELQCKYVSQQRESPGSGA